MCLLAQINPLSPRDSEENVAAQLHHAHQVCGIVAHTADRGVASTALRSLAIASSVLTDIKEQREVMAILERVHRDTGWKLGKVYMELKRAWGWEKIPTFLGAIPSGGPSGSGGTATAGTFMPAPTPQAGIHSPSTTPALAAQYFVPQQQQTQAIPAPGPSVASMAGAGDRRIAATTPAAQRPPVNPLLVQADFSLPNHPYKNWYEPPNRSTAPSSQGFWPP